MVCLIEFLDTHKIISERQCLFCAAKLAEDTITNLTDRIYKELDNLNCQYVLSSWTWAKRLIVNQDHLLGALYKIVDLFKSYLKDRTL